MKIQELFENVLKSSDYPKILEDDWAIAEYIVDNAVTEEPNEFFREMFRDCKAILKLMPISSLIPGDSEHNIPSSKKEKKYLKMTPETMPPIVVEHGIVVDGNHRFRVAKKLGMKNIWAYVIDYEEEL